MPLLHSHRQLAQALVMVVKKAGKYKKKKDVSLVILEV
jgi:hypothetical protein